MSATLTAYIRSLEVEAIADACARIKVMEACLEAAEADLCEVRLTDAELDDKHLELNVTKNLVMRQIRDLDQPQRQQLLVLNNA